VHRPGIHGGFTDGANRRIQSGAVTAGGQDADMFVHSCVHVFARPSMTKRRGATRTLGQWNTRISDGTYLLRQGYFFINFSSRSYLQNTLFAQTLRYYHFLSFNIKYINLV
jgi:hypothetical protein